MKVKLASILVITLLSYGNCASIKCSDGFISTAPVVQSFYAGTRKCTLEDVYINGDLWASNAQLILKNVKVSKNMYINGCKSIKVVGTFSVGLLGRFFCDRALDNVDLPLTSSFGSLFFTGNSFSFYGKSGSFLVNGANSVTLGEKSEVYGFKVIYARNVNLYKSSIGAGGVEINYVRDTSIKCSSIAGNLAFNQHGYSASIGCNEYAIKIMGDIKISRRSGPVELFGIDAPNSALSLLGDFRNTLSVSNIDVKSVLIQNYFVASMKQSKVIGEFSFVHIYDMTVVDSYFGSGIELRNVAKLVLKRNNMANNLALMNAASKWGNEGYDISNNINMKTEIINTAARPIIFSNNTGTSAIFTTVRGTCVVTGNRNMKMTFLRLSSMDMTFKNNIGCTAKFASSWGKFDISENSDLALDFDTGGKTITVSKNKAQSVKLHGISGYIELRDNTITSASCRKNNLFIIASNNNIDKADGWCGGS